MRRQRALDGVRGVAIAAVLITHAREQLLPGGFFGVDLFFVLSGYLITRLLAVEARTEGAVDRPAFYWRRACRLAPALIAGLALWLLIDLTVGSNAPHSSTPSVLAAVLLYAANWSLAAGINLGSLSHMWSLAIEEQFYLLWPFLLVLLLRRARPARWLGAAIVVILVARPVFAVVLHAHAVDDWTPLRADGLLLGALLALRPELLSQVRRTMPLALLVALAGLLFVGWGHVPHQSAAMFTLGFPLAAALGAGLIAHAVTPGRSAGKWLLECPPLTMLGRVSYGLYVYHYPIFYMAVPGSPSGVPDRLIKYGLTALVTWLSWRYLEQPALRAKDRVPGRQRRQVPETSSN